MNEELTMPNLSRNELNGKGMKLPKFIETELGKEKLCIECQEYWPLDKEFWFTYRNKLNKQGIRTIGYEAACKCCYKIRYKPQLVKGTKRIKSYFEKERAS